MTVEYIRNCITGICLLFVVPSCFYFWGIIIDLERNNKLNQYVRIEKRNKNDKKN